MVLQVARWFYKGNGMPNLLYLLSLLSVMAGFCFDSVSFFHIMTHGGPLVVTFPPFGWFFLLYLFICGATVSTRPALIQNGRLAGTGYVMTTKSCQTGQQLSLGATLALLS
jgi:hypothetical protein